MIAEARRWEPPPERGRQGRGGPPGGIGGRVPPGRDESGR